MRRLRGGFLGILGPFPLWQTPKNLPPGQTPAGAHEPASGLTWSPDLVTGTRFPPNSMKCDFPSRTSTSLDFATSEKCSWCSKVLSSLSSVMQKTRSRASKVSCRLAKTTNLKMENIANKVLCYFPETVNHICFVLGIIINRTKSVNRHKHFRKGMTE